MNLHRLYYVADSLENTVSIARNLEKRGIGYDQMHVLSKNEAGLLRHHIHTATPLEDHEIIKMGERGGILGSIAGLIFIIGLSIVDPFEMEISFWVLFLIWVLFSMHGAWAGGLVGTHARNYRISRFEKDIENGKYLMMIDVGDAQERLVHSVIDIDHRDEARYEGESPAHSGPFDGLHFFRRT